MRTVRPEGEKRKQDISRSLRQCVACFGDLAAIDQPRLYFLLSPWTHFLAPGLGHRKKQQPREGETQRERESERMERGRERGEKKQQLDSELKLELIPSALFNTTLFLFSLQLFPLGPSWRDILQTVALICQTMLSFKDVSNKYIHRNTLRLRSRPRL